MRTVAYTRLSVAGDNHAIQEKDIRVQAARDGATIDCVVRDDDRSAWRETVVREGFEQILGWCQAGDVDAVYAWRLDRLCRLPRDLVRVEHFLRRGVDWRFADGSKVERGIASAVSYLQVLSAREESDVKSMRVSRKLRDLAELGAPHARQMKTFGFRDDEKVILDDIVARVIGGESIRSIVTDLRARDVRTTAGNLWTTTALSQTLRRPVLAGFRIHNGERHRGNWEPVIDPETWYRLQQILERNTWCKSPPIEDRAIVRGLVHCGRCGWKMTTKRMKGKPAYVCYSRPERPSCGSIAGLTEHVDQVVTERFLVRLLEPGSRNSVAQIVEGKDVADQEAIRAELESVAQAIRETEDDRYRAGVIDRARYLELRSPLDQRRRELEGQLRPYEAVNPPSAGTIVDRWEEAPFELRRVWIADYVHRVTLEPATKKTPRVFERDRVKVEWLR